MQILHIDSAITGTNSVSRELTASIVDSLKQANPEAKVDYLDLAVNAPTHLNAQSMGFRTGQAATTDIERQENAISEALVSQFLAADVIVIGAPFYNFSIPSQLKAWIDRVMVAGKTFRYTAEGPQGLAGGRKVIVAATYGGQHPVESGRNFVEPYLRQVFGFVGITDVEFVDAAGLNISPEQRTLALEAAEQRIDEIALPLAA